MALPVSKSQILGEEQGPAKLYAQHFLTNFLHSLHTAGFSGGLKSGQVSR